MSALPADILSRWTSQAEGQFFDRKSAFEQRGGVRRQRKTADLARDIVETLSAMANADGGELVIGIEDEGTLSGVPHPPDKLEMLCAAPVNQNNVNPILRSRGQIIFTETGGTLLHFQVDWSPQVHRLASGRYLLRVNDSNQPFDAGQIAALKHTKGQGLLERSFPFGATQSDIDGVLLKRLFGNIHPRSSVEELLMLYRLAEGHNGQLSPNLAGLLLFGKDPVRWHPRCGIDFVRWEGTERKHGAELNVVKRIAAESPLALLPQLAHEAIRPFIRERQTLSDLFFTEQLEYPTFVWQEAIVNAVAHRDYHIQGSAIEVWMFDDRMEIRSPGQPPAPITIETLIRREGVHLSRNPIMMRVLAALGYVRELGEGIPRMFAEMEREGFYPPQFDLIGDFVFHVTLRNQPVYSRETLEWLKQFAEIDLTGDQKRLLVYAKAHGEQFTSREFQKMIGFGIYEASNEIKALIRKGLVRQRRKGGKVYELVGFSQASPIEPAELKQLMPTLQKQGYITNQDIRATLALDRKSALRLAQRLVDGGWLARIGQKRWARYILPQ